MKVDSKREMEYELKFDLGAEKNYKRLVAELGDAVSDVRQSNYFFDTSSNHLSNSRWALRIRTCSESAIDNSSSIVKAEITFKGPQEGSKRISARTEINAEISLSIATAAIAGGFDLTSLDSEPITEVRKIIGDQKVIPLVSFQNRRLTFDMKPDLEFPLEVDLTTFHENLTRYELEIELLEPSDRDIDRTEAYVKSLFKELEIPYISQHVSKLAFALQESGSAI